MVSCTYVFSNTSIEKKTFSALEKNELYEHIPVRYNVVGDNVVLVKVMSQIAGLCKTSIHLKRLFTPLLYNYVLF